MGLIKWILEGDNRRNLKKIEAIAQKVEALEEKYKAMSEEELKGMTAVLKSVLTKTMKHLTIFFPMRSQPLERRVGVFWECVIITFKLSVVSRYTKDVLPKCVQVKVKRLYQHFPLTLTR